MKVVGVILYLIFGAVGFYQYEKIKSQLSEDAVKLMERTLKFSFIYLIAHLFYFSLLFYSLSTSAAYIAIKPWFWKMSLTALIFPLLYQFAILPKLHHNGTLHFSEMKISVDFATIVSLIALFTLENGFGDGDKTLVTLFTGIAIYFALSKVLISMLTVLDKSEAVK